MLQLHNISRSFGHLKILKDVSLTVGDGEVVSIMGPSGAGKTTLLQIMGTLDTPDTGTVVYDGENVTAMSDSEVSRFRNRALGFVFQNHQLLPEFTLVENVMMPALIAGETPAEAQNKARRLLDEVGLLARENHKPAELSGGECQRGAVARALINNPKLILADEPTGNLDTANSDELSRLFFDLRKSHGTTFVIVTHDKEMASRCDRIIYLSDGKIVNT